MTTVEKIMLAGYIVMAFFFVADLIIGSVFGYIEGKRELELEKRMDIILERIEKNYEENIFPEFGVK